MKRITIIASGTRGDVQPAIALGTALRLAGYRVRLVASSGFRDWIERHGLEVAPSRVDMAALMASETGREWVDRGHNVVVQLRLMQRLFDHVGAQLIEEAWAASQDADAVVGSFTSDTYALAIGERRDVPVLSMPLQPTLVATRDGRAMTNAPLPDRVSRLNAWFGRLFIEPVPWRLNGDHVNRFRRSVGLAPQTGWQNVAARRRMTILHAVSRYVLPRPDDWPEDFYVTGYWFLDEGAGWHPTERLLDFLGSGALPICVGFGSMTGGDPAGTTRLLIDAVRLSGQRAVLLAGWAGIGSLQVPADVLVLAEAPHGWLFPRVAAVVHHGGAGTTAAALAAGVPSVVVPHIADQPYWGRRVHALGVGPAPLPRHRLTAAGLAAAIERAVSDRAMARNAVAVGALVRAEDGLREAVSIVQRTLGP